MAKKTTTKTEPRTKKSGGIPESLNTPEFNTAWTAWRRFTAERSLDLRPEDAERQLKLLAKLGPDKAIADIHKTMENHPLKDGAPAAAKAAEKATSEKKAKKPKPAKESKLEKKPAAKKMSALDAAAKVLEEKGEAMNCQELIAAMSAKGYWTSPGGQTPHATLYSAILRELNTKGKDARFKKVEKGKFATNK